MLLWKCRVCTLLPSRQSPRALTNSPLRSHTVDTLPQPQRTFASNTSSPTTSCASTRRSSSVSFPFLPFSSLAAASSFGIMRFFTRSESAKLFVIGLLRTVSALATSSTTSSSSTRTTKATTLRMNNLAAAGVGTTRSASSLQRQEAAFVVDDSDLIYQEPRRDEAPTPLTLRLARRTDVPSIQRCNLATLPENYNQQFYVDHMRQWPDLAVVAIDPTCSSGGGAMVPDGFGSLTPRETSGPTFGPSFLQHGDEKVVAYVLGKVEERIIPQDVLDDYPCDASYVPSTERLGHVTSLAVLEPYRRRGLAQELMKQLHHHLEQTYGVSSVGLHVRKSNVAAEELYTNFGYYKKDCIKEYYQDGEDAYFMKKDLKPRPKVSAKGARLQGEGDNAKRSSRIANGMEIFGSILRGGRMPVPPELRLPRIVGMPHTPVSESDSETELPATSQSSPRVAISRQQVRQEEEEEEELLTGTM